MSTKWLFNYLAAVVAGSSLSALTLNPAQAEAWVFEGKPLSQEMSAKVDQYQAGFKLFQQGRIKEAEAQMKVILAVKPEMPAFQQNYAFVLIRLGRNEEAIKVLEHVIEKEPDIASAWGNLAGAYGAVGRNQDAIKAYKEYMRLYPKNPNIDAVKSIVEIMERELWRNTNLPTASQDDYYAEAVTSEGFKRWPAQLQPLKVCLVAGGNIPGYKPTFLAAAKQAFKDWEAISGGKIQFEFVDSPDKANIKCTWSDDPHKLIAQAEGGHASVYNQGDRITSAEIILRTLTPVPDVAVSDNLTHRFALHEIGHVLGLIGHSRDPKDALYFGLALSEEPMKLSARDTNTLKKLYDTDAKAIDKAPNALSPNTVLHNLSDAAAKARAKGDLDMAEKFALLEMAEAGKFGKQDVRFAKSLSDLGAVYLDRSKFQDAEMAFGVAQKIYVASAASNQGELANVYSNLGTVYFKTGRHSQAEAALRKSIEIREKSSSANSEQMVQTLKKYAEILRAQNRVAEAQTAENRATSIETRPQPSLR